MPLNQAVEGSQQLVWYNPKQQTHAHNDVKLNFCEITRGVKAYRTALSLIVVNVYANAREWFTCTSRCSNHTVTCPVLTVTWTTGGFWRSLDSRCTRSGRTVRKNRFAIHIAYLHVFHTQLACCVAERKVCLWNWWWAGVVYKRWSKYCIWWSTLWRLLLPCGYSYPVSDRVKSSFVIFDIRALWRLCLSVRVSGCQKLQMTT